VLSTSCIVKTIGDVIRYYVASGKVQLPLAQ